MNIRLFCPECATPSRLRLPGPGEWECPRCDRLVRLPEGKTDPSLSVCLVCGNHELYKKKDFPHWLGMTILVVACLASVVTYLWYEKWLTWAILIGSALIDGALYLSVGDAIVCYRCGAHHKGLTPTDAHRPFELTVGERYWQEKIRADQLRHRRENPTHPAS